MYNHNVQHSILVIEDDDSIAEVIAMVIRQEMGYRAQVVASGEEALVALNASSPDLIILDYYLSDMTGIDLFDQLKLKDHIKDIPVLLVSASSHESEATARHLAVLDKPFEIDELVENIESLLTRQTCLPLHF